MKLLGIVFLPLGGGGGIEDMRLVAALIALNVLIILFGVIGYFFYKRKGYSFIRTCWSQDNSPFLFPPLWMLAVLDGMAFVFWMIDITYKLIS